MISNKTKEMVKLAKAYVGEKLQNGKKLVFPPKIVKCLT
jgi:hypothetical protein